MTTDLPGHGDQSAADHAAISRRFLEHAREELLKGDRLQVSEKAWGASAHALKSIAAQRGWRHGRHDLIFAIAEQIAREYDRLDITNTLGIANSFHVNFYENQLGEASIRPALDAIERMVAGLEELRLSPPRPFTVRSSEDQGRLQRLLGRQVPMNEHSESGFGL